MQLQAASSSTDRLSMWETLLKVSYEDFELSAEDVVYCKNLTETFQQCFTENNNKILGNAVECGQIPITDHQGESTLWHESRQYRITASICKSAVLFGEKLSPEAAKIPLFNWLRAKIWFPENIVTLDMKYGIEQEPNAISYYSKCKSVDVKSSGLWIHKKYPHLGASPDGLMWENNDLVGIVEVKCLKILKGHTIQEFIDSFENGKISDQVKRQCFHVIGRNLVLKKSHSYYFQVQLQLLITEAKYCDFILYSNVGDARIERIYKDIKLQERIVRSSKIFWSQVMIPEYFLMRIPRRLLPIIFSLDKE